MSNVLEYNQLQEILPHAYPFVLLDRVIDFKAGEYLTAIKNITANDCSGGDCSADEHGAAFPEVFLIEAAAQAALVLYRASRPEERSDSLFVLGKAKAEFNEAVTVGDQVALKVSAGRVLSGGGYSDVNVSVGEKPVAEIQVFYACLPVGRGVRK